MRRHLLLLLGLAACMWAVNPGVEVRLGFPLLAALKDAAIELVQQDLRTMNIPDITGTADVEVGDLNYVLSSIVVTGLNIPSSELLIAGTNSMEAAAGQITASATFNWGWTKTTWPTMSDAGTGTVQISGTTVEMVLGFSSANGRPVVASQSCVVTVTNVDVDLSGGGGWLYDVFIPLFESDIRTGVQTGVQNGVQNAIQNQVAAALAGVDVIEPINDVLRLDMSLLADPTFLNSYLVTDHKGLFVTNPVLTIPSQAAFPSINAAENTVDVVVADAAFSSALAAMYQAGNFTFHVTELPASLPVQMNTKSFQKLIPALYNAYPDTPLVADVRAAAPPLVTISKVGVNVSATLIVDVSAVTATGTELAGTVSVAIDAVGEAHTHSADGETWALCGSVTTLAIELSLVSSQVGVINMKQLQSMVNYVSAHVLLPHLSDLLAEGRPLPILRGISLADPEITYGQGYMLLVAGVTATQAQLVALLSGH